MDANKGELVLSNSMFASDEQFSEDDLLDTNCRQGVTWLNNDENEKLDMSINIDATNMFFNRVESAEIIYQAKKKTCKMIGKYVMGDKLGEGKRKNKTLHIMQSKQCTHDTHECIRFCVNNYQIMCHNRLVWESQRGARFRDIVQKSR